MVDVAALGDLLMGRWADIRRASRARAAKPEFQRIPGQSMAEHRERVLTQLHLLVEEGAVQRAFPKQLGGHDDARRQHRPVRGAAARRPSRCRSSRACSGASSAPPCCTSAPSRTTDALLPAIMSLEVPGAFAMTETGHGSDVAAIAHHRHLRRDDRGVRASTRRSARAWKDYLGNAALHGTRARSCSRSSSPRASTTACTRSTCRSATSKGDFLPGIGGEDDGLKGGLERHRQRAAALHARARSALRTCSTATATSTSDGDYTSAHREPRPPVLHHARHARAGSRLARRRRRRSASKLALDDRAHLRQRSAASSPARATTDEEVLLDYQRHQRRLLPHLATTYAHVVRARASSSRSSTRVFSGKARHPRRAPKTSRPSPRRSSRVSTWHALEILQEAREACGGAGFLAENRHRAACARTSTST